MTIKSSETIKMLEKAFLDGMADRKIKDQLYDAVTIYGGMVSKVMQTLRDKGISRATVLDDEHEKFLACRKHLLAITDDRNLLLNIYEYSHLATVRYPYILQYLPFVVEIRTSYLNGFNQYVVKSGATLQEK